MKNQFARTYRVTILFGLLFILTFSAHAQVIRSYGAKGGMVLANQRYEITPLDYRVETQPIVRPAMGVFAELFYHPYLSVQTDLMYIGKGSRTSTESLTVNHRDNDNVTVNEGPETSSTYHYLSFSPMVRFRIEDLGLTYFALLGPRFERLFGYNTTSEYPLERRETNAFGLTAGIGAEYSMESMEAFAELQFQPDMTAVTEDEPLLVKNRLFMLTLGVRFMQ